MNIDLIPNGAIKRVHVSQNDVGRTLTFELFNNSTSYTIPSGAVVKIQGTKPSGFGFSETCTVSGNVVTVDTTEEMTDEYGYIDTELQIKYNGNTIGTSNFVLAVERNPHPDTTTDGSMETIIPELTLLVNAVKGYAEEIEGTYHAYGSPWVASTVAQMTDTDKIYVYTGSESGYTNGNWYYYNGSSWVSGDVYNAVAVQTDTTLSVNGMPADAEAVGEAVKGIEQNLSYDNQTYSPTWVNGTISSTGADSTTNAGIRIRTGYIYVGNLDRLSVKSDSGYMSYYCYYDKDKVYKGETSWATGEVLIKPSANIVYVRLLLRLTSNGSISPSDGTHCTIVGTTKLETEKANANIVNAMKLPASRIAFGETGKQIFDYTQAIYKGYYDSNKWIPRDDMLGGYCIVNGMEYITFNSGGQRIWASFLTASLDVISVHEAILPSDTPLAVPDGAYYFYLASGTANVPYLIITEGQTSFDKTEYKQFINIPNLNNRNILSESIGHGLNLYNKQSVTYGYRYTYSTGDYVTDSNGYYASTFIPVEAETTYALYTNSAHLCYWDVHKDYISGAIGSTGFSTIATPVNCAYMTISTQRPDFTTLSKGSTQIEYEPYYEYLLYGKNVPETFTTDYIYRTFDVPETNSLTASTNTNTACLKLPASYTQNGTPTKLCIIVHGSTKGISSTDTSDWTHNASYNNIVTALNNAGYAVMDSNGYDDSSTAGHEHWGCPQAVAGYIKAYEYFTEHYNLAREVYIYGFSMGGLTALNIMTARPFPIKCGMVASSVISLYDQCVSGSVNSYFLEAYGIASYDRAYLYGSDRYLDITTVGNTPYVFNNLPPLFMAYGTSDTAVSNTIIQEYYTALYNSNHVVRLKSYDGGHEISYGGNADEIADIVKWFGYY